MNAPMNPWLVNNRWVKEARDLSPDSVSGARLTRLSGSSIRTENIYGDSPRASKDGNRFVSMRYVDHLLTPNGALMCHDLKTKFTCLLEKEAGGSPISPAWGGAVYYTRGTELRRACLESCDSQPVIDLEPLPPCWQLMSVSADERYLLYTTMEWSNSSELYNIVRIDLRDKSWKFLLEQPYPSRCGASFNPSRGYDLLITKAVWRDGVRYGISFAADPDGKNEREVMRDVHHSCWLGDTGKFAGLINFNPENFSHHPQNPDGELFVYSKDGTPPRLVPVPEHILFHISASPCGQYVVCESLESGLEPGPVPIVVINVDSGRYRTLVRDAKCSHGGDAGRQVNPYFTADMRHVIFNGDPDGVVNVFAAEIPNGFLDSLNR